ncbi:hypothetical protein HPB51_014331 [Rhipicephalus microplus]|uniref:Uncharacterized protein n=1 Tax=Rhipicephalus microplus TaxID=6941 RepID=A0A9J6ENN5_RHIMP|nr:hypothetical protein HPB51_014331 [Rhipicephalus microplus]
MAAALEVDEFPTLATTSATGQPQRRLTTLRPAKRPEPNDAVDDQESHLPEKAPAQVAATTTTEGRHAASQAVAPTQVSMSREEREEEGGRHVGHVFPAAPSQAAAAEAERVADSGERGKQADHSARSVSGDDETEDDAASTVSWASVEEMAVGESCLERGRCDRKENQEDRVQEDRVSCPNCALRLSLKAQSRQETSAATFSEWWNKKGDEDDARHGREALLFAGDKTPSSPVEQHMSKKASGGEGAPKHTEPSSPSRRQQPSEPVPQHGDATQRRGREESQHGAVGMKPSREKMAADVLEAQKAAALSDELEPGELVIDERALTHEPPNRTPQEAFSMPAGVGRGRNGRSRDPEAAHGSILSLSLRPSGPGAHTETKEKRTQRRTKKARRDVAGCRRDLTPGSEHEEATSKQRSNQQSATGDVDTDSDFN